MDLMDKVVALAKRRGFIFPGSEIYGGLSGTWDYGPLGTALARHIKKDWWNNLVLHRDDVVGLDSSILLHAKTWAASGHVASFTDPLIECKKCHNRFRQDQIGDVCPECGSHNFTSVQQFNLMFKTHIGPVEAKASQVYLRPETAQGIFINFKNVLDSTRIDIPFGIAQIGKGFRNEITTGNFLFRVREFEMMELEFFVEPGTDQHWHDVWKQDRLKWYINLGINPKHIKIVDLPKSQIAHYSKGTAEIWYRWPFMDFAELEGIANRGDYDLTQHSKYSGQDLSYTNPSGKKFTPYVIEPSVGVGRAMLAFLIDSYTEVGDRVILKLHPKLSPYQVAVFPLLANKIKLVDKANHVYQLLKPYFIATWDDRGNIGKRYYAQDEIGTPFCVTVDFDTLTDDSVTVRDRDTTKQDRVAIDKLTDYLHTKLK